MKYTIFQDTRIGKRPYQQDRLAHWHTRDSLFLVVADGMGGHANGDVAAQIAVDCLGSAFKNEAKTKIADPDAFLFRSIGRAHAMVVHQAARQGLREFAAHHAWSPAWCRTATLSGRSSAIRASTSSARAAS